METEWIYRNEYGERNLVSERASGEKLQWQACSLSLYQRNIQGMTVLILWLIGVGIYIGIFLALQEFMRWRGKQAARSSLFSKENLHVNKENIHENIRSISIALSKQEVCKLLIPSKIDYERPDIIPHSYGISPSIKWSIRKGKLDGAAGEIERLESNRYRITVAVEYWDNPSQRFAVLAHEFAHIWVDSLGLRLPIIIEQERLVDTATVMLGGGILILNGMGSRPSGFEKFGELKNVRFGYLSIGEFFYCVCHYLYARNICEKKLRNELPRFVIKGIRDFKHVVGKEPRLLNQCEGQIVLECDVCFQKVRIKESQGRLSFIARCPVCGREFHIAFLGPSIRVNERVYELPEKD